MQQPKKPIPIWNLLALLNNNTFVDGKGQPELVARDNRIGRISLETDTVRRQHLPPQDYHP